MRLLYTVILIPVILSGCKKYLDEKPDQSLSVPDNLDDLQMLLDDVRSINAGQTAPNSSSDEYYLKPADWEALYQFDKEAYVWDPKTDAQTDWVTFYRNIFTANTVLENLEKLNRNMDPTRWDDLKGRALFIRGMCYFQLAQIFSPYYTGSENSVYGLPLRLNSDFNQPVMRSTLKETWDQLISDIQNALPLLAKTNQYKTQPSKWAANALLARINLLMGNYQKAYDYSNACLGISNALLNFNDLDPSREYPINRLNTEVIYHMATDAPVTSFYWIARVEPALYDSFTSGDLRKKIFFIDNGDGSFSFKGNYTGEYILFTGLATDEIYLTRAEAAVRLNKITEALADLNKLLKARWTTGEFDEITITAPEALLKLILEERKKELMFRGIHWIDLRRLNTDPRFQETLKRNINGQVYLLPPNDPRYVFLIPRKSVDFSNIPQNPR